MTRLLYFLILSSIFYSCQPTTCKKCEIQTDDNSLKAYNDILNEIITRHSYNIYLGSDEEQIFKRYAHNISDSDNIDQNVIKLHNKLFGDTSRFCTIYLDTLLKPAFNPWLYFKKDTSQFSRKIRDLTTEFSDNGQIVIDSLNAIQTKYLPQDFRVCIAKIKSIKELSDDKPKCYIGKIAFSKLILNKAKDKGLLYYELSCGGLCGYGSLVLIAKKKDSWNIQESLTTWIS